MYLHLTEVELSTFLKKKLKSSGITYEEMAAQIEVSLATFKRIIKNPHRATFTTLQALLRELGGDLCIEM